MVNAWRSRRRKTYAFERPDPGKVLLLAKLDLVPMVAVSFIATRER